MWRRRPRASPAYRTTTGPVGTVVTITGTNFGTTPGISTVQFNGTAALPTSWTDTSIVVAAPTGATTGNVVVIVNGKSSNGLSFTVPAGILNNPSFELGLSVPASFTGTW